VGFFYVKTPVRLDHFQGFRMRPVHGNVQMHIRGIAMQGINS
jgi:hypothetical protein